jgi:acyl-coenzyme A synthetase/AMP-(fatty) acid ligase
VRARNSPISGAIVGADVVVGAGFDAGVVEGEVLDTCRRELAAHKVPALLQAVENLDVGAAGKLVRHA